MGWTYMQFNGSKADFIRAEVSLNEYGELVDFAIVGKVIYAAVRLGKRYEQKAGKVVAFIYLTDQNKTDRCNFGYKDIQESMGPYETKCPARVINVLSPVSELYTGSSADYARRWRSDCLGRPYVEATPRAAPAVALTLF